MRGASRLYPAPGRLESTVLIRLILGLALLHGCGHAASEETNGGLGEIDVVERVVERMEGIGRAVDEAAGIVVVDCDVKVEGKCADSGPPVTEIGETTELVDEGAVEVVDEAAAALANVGECSGRRFKKCR